MLHPRIGAAAGSAPRARLRPMAAGTDRNGAGTLPVIAGAGGTDFAPRRRIAAGP